MKVIIINGPNLNLLEKRDKNQYSQLNLQQILKLTRTEFLDIQIDSFQSNIEGELIDKIQEADKQYDGLIINPGGYSHTSVAIRDALELCKIPKIEVHLSHIANREEFRQKMITATGTNGYLSGFRENSYLAAIYIIKKLIVK
jgi:3-dehydroquinate dehydratase II